jgi:hypothetical protein
MLFPMLPGRVDKKRRLLEPTLFSLKISPDEFFVRFREIDYSFNDADHAWHYSKDATAKDGYEQHDYAFSGVAEDELVNTEGSYYDSQHTREHFFVGTHRLPISYRSRSTLIHGLHWLVTADRG